MKRNIFLILLVSLSHLGFADLSSVCKFVAFCSPVANSSATLEDLVRQFGEDYVLEVHRPLDFSVHSSIDDKVYSYIFSSGAQFHYYYNSQSEKSFLFSWVMFPEFLPNGSYPKTMWECRNVFGKEYNYHDQCLFYSLGGGVLGFKFNAENKYFEEVTWSLWD